MASPCLSLTIACLRLGRESHNLYSKGNPYEHDVHNRQVGWNNYWKVMKWAGGGLVTGVALVAFGHLLGAASTAGLILTIAGMGITISSGALWLHRSAFRCYELYQEQYETRRLPNRL
jgi:hypothetical protein